MEDNKFKDGISVKEIENFTKKHRFEVFFCLAFILACFFTFVMYSGWWSVLASTIGGIVGVLAPNQVGKFASSLMHFVFKQENTTQLVFGGVLLILAIFLSPLIFLLLGLHGGKHIHSTASEISSRK